MKYISALPLLGFVVLVSFFATGLQLHPREIPSPLVGKQMPGFELPSLTNPNTKVSSEQLSTRFSLINVWASWCSHCRREHPLLMAISQEKQIPIYGLNYKDSPKDARNLLEKTGNPYVDSGVDLDGRVGLEFGVYGVPETFLVDDNGQILYKHIGALTRDTFEREILARVRGGIDAS